MRGSRIRIRSPSACWGVGARPWPRRLNHRGGRRNRRRPRVAHSCPPFVEDVSKLVGSLKAIDGFFRHRLRHDGAEGRIDVRSGDVKGSDVAKNNLKQELVECLCGERNAPRGSLVQDDPYGVDIAARVGFGALGLLRRHVERSAHHAAGPGHLYRSIGSRKLRYSKIDDFDEIAMTCLLL